MTSVVRFFFDNNTEWSKITVVTVSHTVSDQLEPIKASGDEILFLIIVDRLNENLDYRWWETCDGIIR